MKTIKIDVAIFGGGVAGLWTLHHVIEAGVSAVLFETNTLGSGQTLQSQGIIHGGIKYSLNGLLSRSTDPIQDMPALWGECFRGAVCDLSSVTILSQYHYLWSTQQFTARFSQFMAGKMLQHVDKTLKKSDYPEIFQQPQFSGHVSAIRETVIDTKSLLTALHQKNADKIVKINLPTPEDIQFLPSGAIQSITLQSGQQPATAIQAKKYVFTAGAGNEKLLSTITPPIPMQRRPLHMVLAKFPKEAPQQYPLYGHCMGRDAKPRITITTHRCEDGCMVWYLGGELSETGVSRDSAAQIQFAQKELAATLPWVDISPVQWRSFFIDRAEGQQPEGRRPADVVLKHEQNVLVGWPTKLALAPKLANHITQAIQATPFEQCPFSPATFQDWEKASVGEPIWEGLF